MISGSFADQIRTLFVGYRQADVVAFSTVLFFISATSLGLNVILPTYLSQTHAASAVSASGIIAGAFLVGVLLTKGVAPRIILAVLTAFLCCAFCVLRLTNG